MNSLHIGLVSSAMNSGGDKPKAFHPWPVHRNASRQPSGSSTTTHTKNAESVTTTDAAPEVDQESIRYSTDSESILKGTGIPSPSSSSPSPAGFEKTESTTNDRMCVLSDSSHSSTKTKKPNLLKKIVGRSAK